MQHGIGRVTLLAERSCLRLLDGWSRAFRIFAVVDTNVKHVNTTLNQLHDGTNRGWWRMAALTIEKFQGQSRGSRCLRPSRPQRNRNRRLGNEAEQDE
jgi:hypothetical protein